MRIETYFQQIQRAIDGCSFVQAFNVTYDKRGTYEGFIRGELCFIDGSMLHIREFVDTETTVDHLTYVYQYMDPSHKLVFRYDNTGHHKKLRLSTYPHHKHEEDEQYVISSLAPTLDAVLYEIEAIVQVS